MRHIRIFTSQILSADMKKDGPGGDRAVRALSRAWGNADEAHSEVELQTQWHHSWIVHARDRTKRARTKRRAQSVEIGVVEGVEHFTAKLQAGGLPRKLDVLDNGDVPALDAGTNHDAAAGIAGGNRPVRHLRKNARVEELSQCLWCAALGLPLMFGRGPAALRPRIRDRLDRRWRSSRSKAHRKKLRRSSPCPS